MINFRTAESTPEKGESSSEKDTAWLIEELFKIFEWLWPKNLFESQYGKDLKESKILSVLRRTKSDDFARDIDLLMYNGNRDKKSSSFDKYFLRCAVNLAWLKVSQTTDKEELEKWLDILLRISKFLLLASETWTTKDSTYYTKVQNRWAESIAFIIVFLYREILCHTGK
jgi:hypothetical protein